MAANGQSQAISIANQMFTLAQSVVNIYTQMVAIDAQWSDNGVATVLAAMGTVVLNSDGSTGAADGSPNTAHPLDPTKYPTLQRSLSSTQITQLKTELDNLVSHINGNAVGATAGARAILNSAVG